MRSPADLASLFRARGLKVTPQRACIFRILDGNESHPTAEAVFGAASREMATMSLKTVYQTLNELAELGEIQLLDMGTGSTRFDPNVDAHHHLVCTRCGKVRDLYARFGGLHVPPAKRRGFRIGASRLSSGASAPTAGAPVRDHQTRGSRPPFPRNQRRKISTMALKGSKTHDNLKEAFAGESQANRRYLYFAQKADVEGYPDVAALFRSVAEGETGHAFGHFDFLAEVGDPVTGESVGPTADNLKSAIAGETYEYTEMYPGFAKTARDEGFEAIAEWLETLARAEKSHAGRFTQGLQALS